MQRRPNFLIIVTDQQRADYLGSYGHPMIRTPHIDAIAQGATIFERCYVASPLCMPNRASIMTGRMPSAHGVRTNGIPLSPNTVTFADVLRAEGYMTGLVGKAHLQTMVKAPPSFLDRFSGWTRPGRNSWPTEARMEPGSSDPFREIHSDMLQEPFLPERSASYFGFDHARLVTMSGDMAGGDYLGWLAGKVARPQDIRGEANAIATSYICPQAYRTAVPEELYPTRYIAECAKDFLMKSAEASAGKRPFALVVSFPDPHHPFTPPGQFWDLYNPDDVDLPSSFFASRSSAPPHLAKAFADLENGCRDPKSSISFAVTEREAREAIALTMGSISCIDAAVGDIMSALSSLNMADDTVTVFTSDHGDHLGSHGLLLKGPCQYQELLRVPLIWNDPQAQPDRRAGARMCSSIDIAPTILARSRILPYAGIQGRDLFSEPRQTSDEMLLVEYEYQKPALDIPGPIRQRTLVTPKWRLSIIDGVSWGELYNLVSDPEELTNLWDDPSCWPVRHQLTESMVRLMLRQTDVIPLPRAVA